MQMLRMMVTAAVILMMGTATEAARTLDAADRTALRKGYTGAKAKCYAEVSRQYYKPGTLRVSGRSAPGWKLELLHRCGVSR